MRAGVEYRLPLKVRRFECLVRPLTISETVLVAEDVARRIQALPEVARTRGVEHSTFAKLTLIRASTSEPGATDAAFSEYVLDQLTPDELDFIFKQYVAVTDKVNPSIEIMPLDKVQEMAEALKKSPSGVIELSFLQLANLVRYFLTKND